MDRLNPYCINTVRFCTYTDRDEVHILLAAPRTAKGKSLWFEVCIIVGYLCGLAGKFISGNVTYVAAFYILDIAMVTTDLVLTVRNKRLDQAAEQEETV